MKISEYRAAQLALEQKRTLENYRRLNQIVKKGQVVFAGSSLMQFFPINELAQSLDIQKCVYNRGISGYISSQMLAHIDTQILDLEPSMLFLNIGTNDLGRGIENELWENYPKILQKVHSKFPACKIYIMAFYPCNNEADFGADQEARKVMFATRTPESLLAANKKLQELAKNMDCTYIDVNEGLYDDNGLLKESFGIDGVHMYADAYILVMKNLKKYLKG